MQRYCPPVLRAVKIALAFVAVMSVAYVLISPDLDEVDGILRAQQIAKTSTTLAYASEEWLPIFNTHLRYFAATSALLQLDKPALSDLICARLC